MQDNLAFQPGIQEWARGDPAASIKEFVHVQLKTPEILILRRTLSSTRSSASEGKNLMAGDHEPLLQKLQKKVAGERNALQCE